MTIYFSIGITLSYKCEHLEKLEDKRYGAFEYESVLRCRVHLPSEGEIGMEPADNKSYNYLMLSLGYSRGSLKNQFVKNLFNQFPETSIFFVENTKFPDLNNETFPHGSPENLTYLLLRKADIKHLKNDTFAGLSHLEILDLSENHISVVDENAFNKLEFLKFLYLNMNNIKEFHDTTFDYLRSLEILGAGRNKIEELSNLKFTNSTNIKFLDFSSNQIEVLMPKKLFSDLTNLKKVDLFGNKISLISEDLLKLFSNLTLLDLSNNDCVNQLFEYRKIPKNPTLLLKTILFPLCSYNINFEPEETDSKLQFWWILIGIPVIVLTVVAIGIIISKLLIWIKKRKISSQNQEAETENILAETAIEYTCNTSLHGIQYLGYKKGYRFEKCFWILIFLVVIGLTSRFIYESYIKWQTDLIFIGFDKKVICLIFYKHIEEFNALFSGDSYMGSAFPSHHNLS